MSSYWNNNGTYQADYDRLQGLMPFMGKADTTAGELIRAASAIGYDFYNNGFINNKSGALNFISQHGVLAGTDIYTKLHDHTRGLCYEGDFNDNDSIVIAVEKLIDLTIETIVKNPLLEQQENTVDIYDLSDDNYQYEDEDEDEEYY